ncbi:hypothetical protein C5167_003959 [Papaver somniferum]|nr:hypothetical protein C5167_003959 [Papaver somniferum]
MDDLESRYEALKFEHRKIEKDQAIVKRAQALEQFQENVLHAYEERDRIRGENEAFVARENLVRFRLRIESDDDFEWALSVVENAMVEIAKRDSLGIDHAETLKENISGNEDTEKEQIQKIEDLSMELESLKLKLCSRDSKYSKLKRVLTSSVANPKKNELRERNNHVQFVAKLICAQYGNPLPNLNLIVVPPNEEVEDISSSEWEDGEEYIEGEYKDEEELSGDELFEGHSEGDLLDGRERVFDEVLGGDTVNT